MAEISGGFYFEEANLRQLPAKVASACVPERRIVGESEVMHHWGTLLLFFFLFIWQWWVSAR
jgi:hypothetical protein